MRRFVRAAFPYPAVKGVLVVGSGPMLDCAAGDATGLIAANSAISSEVVFEPVRTLWIISNPILALGHAEFSEAEHGPRGPVIAHKRNSVQGRAVNRLLIVSDKPRAWITSAISALEISADHVAVASVGSVWRIQLFQLGLAASFRLLSSHVKVFVEWVNRRVSGREQSELRQRLPAVLRTSTGMTGVLIANRFLSAFARDSRGISLSGTDYVFGARATPGAFSANHLPADFAVANSVVAEAKTDWAELRKIVTDGPQVPN